MRIMLIEDDKSLSKIISGELLRYHHDCFAVQDFENVLTAFSEYDPHLILLDVNLPVYDGFYLCGEIRKQSRIPIIFISARDSNMDIVMAVSQGGDDYVPKPFSMEVLMAKITALLRRSYDYETTPSLLDIQHGYALDLHLHALKTPGGSKDLTRNEYLILKCLLGRANQVVSREEIMRALWEDERFIDDNTLTVNINRLRQTLAESGLKDVIVTKKGFGYLLRANP